MNSQIAELSDLSQILYSAFMWYIIESYIIVIPSLFKFWVEKMVLVTSWFYLPSRRTQGVCGVCLDKKKASCSPQVNVYSHAALKKQRSVGIRKKNLWFSDLHTWNGNTVSEITFSCTALSSEKSSFKPAALLWLQFVSATIYQIWCRCGSSLLRVYFIFLLYYSPW